MPGKKIYYIRKTHRGRDTVIKGTLDELKKYFKYTIDCGHSWNNRINDDPKTFRSLLSTLEKCVEETQGGCYERDSYWESDEEEYETAERKSEA